MIASTWNSSNLLGSFYLKFIFCSACTGIWYFGKNNGRYFRAVGSKSGVTITGYQLQICWYPFIYSNPESHLTSLQVSPITHSGVWADCDTSNKLYNNDWFLWFVNRSNSSRINRIDWLSCPPKKIMYQGFKELDRRPITRFTVHNPTDMKILPKAPGWGPWSQFYAIQTSQPAHNKYTTMTPLLLDTFIQ